MFDLVSSGIGRVLGRTCRIDHFRCCGLPRGEVVGRAAAVRLFSVPGMALVGEGTAGVDRGGARTSPLWKGDDIAAASGRVRAYPDVDRLALSRDVLGPDLQLLLGVGLQIDESAAWKRRLETEAPVLILSSG